MRWRKEGREKAMVERVREDNDNGKIRVEKEDGNWEKKKRKV